MTNSFILLSVVFAALGAVLGCRVHAQAPSPAVPKVILEMKPGDEKRLVPTSEQVGVTRSLTATTPGLVVNIQPGKEGYPGVSLKPEGAAWNLSAFGHVTARVINLGTKTAYLVAASR